MLIHETVQPRPQSGISYSGDSGGKKSNILMPQPNWYPAFYYTINHSTKSDVLTYPYPLKSGTILIQEEGNFGLEVNHYITYQYHQTFLKLWMNQCLQLSRALQ